MKILLVFLGGGLGSVLRYLVAKWINNNTIPYGTFAVNILGSLIIGLILGYTLKNDVASQYPKLLLATGFCGGFTTFSSFAYENHLYLKSGDITTLLLYVLSTLIIGFTMIFIGVNLSKFI